VRGKLAKMIRLYMIGRHIDVVNERTDRVYVWATESRRGVEKNICISSPPQRRAYQKAKEAYSRGGESKKKRGEGIRRIAELYRKVYSEGIDRQILSNNPSILPNPLQP